MSARTSGPLNPGGAALIFWIAASSSATRTLSGPIWSTVVGVFTAATDVVVEGERNGRKRATIATSRVRNTKYLLTT